MRWGYFEADGKCIAISTDRVPGHTAAHEHQVPDTCKPNTTRMNPQTMEIETFPRPPIPPPPTLKSQLELKVEELEARIRALENPRTH